MDKFIIALSRRTMTRPFQWPLSRVVSVAVGIGLCLMSPYAQSWAQNAQDDMSMPMGSILTMPQDEDDKMEMEPDPAEPDLNPSESEESGGYGLLQHAEAKTLPSQAKADKANPTPVKTISTPKATTIQTPSATIPTSGTLIDTQQKTTVTDLLKRQRAAVARQQASKLAAVKALALQKAMKGKPPAKPSTALANPVVGRIPVVDSELSPVRDPALATIALEKPITPSGASSPDKAELPTLRLTPNPLGVLPLEPPKASFSFLTPATNAPQPATTTPVSGMPSISDPMRTVSLPVEAMPALNAKASQTGISPAVYAGPLPTTASMPSGVPFVPVSFSPPPKKSWLTPEQKEKLKNNVRIGANNLLINTGFKQDPNGPIGYEPLSGIAVFPVLTSGNERAFGDLPIMFAREYAKQMETQVPKTRIYNPIYTVDELRLRGLGRVYDQIMAYYARAGRPEPHAMDYLIKQLSTPENPISRVVFVDADLDTTHTDTPTGPLEWASGLLTDGTPKQVRYFIRGHLQIYDTDSPGLPMVWSGDWDGSIKKDSFYNVTTSVFAESDSTRAFSRVTHDMSQQLIHDMPENAYMNPVYRQSVTGRIASPSELNPGNSSESGPVSGAALPQPDSRP